MRVFGLAHRGTSMWKVLELSISGYETKLDENGIEGSRCVSETIKNPSWGQVRSFVEQLDGDRRDIVDFGGAKGYGLTIGGGPDRFVISVIGDDMGPYSLLGPDLSDEETTIQYGGVTTTDMERKFIVTREQTFQAAEYFYLHGQIDPTLKWHLC